MICYLHIDMSKRSKICPDTSTTDPLQTYTDPSTEVRIRGMVQSMVRAKQNIAYGLPPDYDAPMDKSTTDYISICREIDQYIEQYCVHEFVYDWIDVDPEHSRRIQYCKHCEKTMS